VIRSGVVLAGGASRRFGTDKLAEPIDGVSLLGLAVRALAGLVEEIVVVVAPDRPPPSLGPNDPGRQVRFVADPERFGGPLVGVRTGLAAARGSIVLVVGGDMPSLVPALLVLLLDRAPAALADPAGVLRPLPCALERTAGLAAADELLAGGERRLRALLARLGTAALPWTDWRAEDPGGLTLVDIDVRSDLPRKSRDPDLSIGVPREEEPGPVGEEEDRGSRGNRA
jgi:molybdopterin-guanine dinucleotide biosynthesis protein A